MSQSDHSATPADHASEHLTPPRRLRTVFRKLGPGIIVSASIVGSGELIASTTLGAHIGFAALWLIILSCVVKVVVQEELGRYCISSGETTFEALDRVPGPRWRASWVVWCWMVMMVGVTIQYGGILGGLAQVFHLALPFWSISGWAIVTFALTLALLFRGRYRHIEKTTTALVVSFTVITIVCAVALAWTPFAIRLDNLVEGFRFQLPAGGLAVAFAAFGITGVGATELIYYPYWCLEKGYARFTGLNDQSPAWRQRARGWIRVMQIDALVAMAIYTLATVAFYLLGAGVLYGSQQIPQGYRMVEILSSMYTQTLGPWAFYLFLLGAFFVLFSTIYSSTASNSRVLVDFMELVGLVSIRDESQRLRYWRMIVLLLLSVCTVWFLFMGEPVFMVIVGGITQASMLPIIAFSTIYLRYRHTDPSVRPGRILDVLLWLTSVLMLLFAIYTLSLKLSQWIAEQPG